MRKNRHKTGETERYMEWVMQILFGKGKVNIRTGIQNIVNQSTDQRKFKQKFGCFGAPVRNLIQYGKIFRIDHHDPADDRSIVFTCHNNKRTG